MDTQLWGLISSSWELTLAKGAPFDAVDLARVGLQWRSSNPTFPLPVPAGGAFIVIRQYGPH